MAENVLAFEERIHALQDLVAEADSEEERHDLQALLDQEFARVYVNITPWQRVQLARHPLRPRLLDYTERLFDDFIEIHGDRALGDDPAVVAGIGRFRGETVFVVGHQKGSDMEERVRRNFGMAHPSGYRKAQRVYAMAERLGYPVVSFVDTPAAYPGVEAERYGQGFAIATSLRASAGMRTPIFAVVLGEGGSGGAIAIAVADWVAMFEYAMYTICPPERCAEILWRDIEKRELAAEAMRFTAKDLSALGVIDAVLPEHGGAAHHYPDVAARVLAEELSGFLEGCRSGRWTPERRQEKLRRVGCWSEGPVE